METKQFGEKPTSEVQLNENWKEWIKKRPKSNILALLMFIVLPVVMCIFAMFTSESEGANMAVPFILFALCLLLYLFLNIHTISKMLKPAVFVVSVNGDILTVCRNGKEKLSIKAKDTKKIMMVRQFGDILNLGIYQEAPGVFSSGKGYRLMLGFIPKEEIAEFIKLLQTFYGKEQLNALTTVTGPMG